MYTCMCLLSHLWLESDIPEPSVYKFISSSSVLVMGTDHALRHSAGGNTYTYIQYIQDIYNIYTIYTICINNKCMYIYLSLTTHSAIVSVAPAVATRAST